MTFSYIILLKYTTTIGISDNQSVANIHFIFIKLQFCKKKIFFFTFTTYVIYLIVYLHL